MPPPVAVNGGGASPPPLLPHQRGTPPPLDGKGPLLPPASGSNGTPRTIGNRPLPHTVRETTLPAALSASLARLAGREPPRPPEPPKAPAPPDRERSEA
jgi:hypothetical protein